MRGRPGPIPWVPHLTQLLQSHLTANKLRALDRREGTAPHLPDLRCGGSGPHDSYGDVVACDLVAETEVERRRILSLKRPARAYRGYPSSFVCRKIDRHTCPDRSRIPTGLINESHLDPVLVDRKIVAPQGWRSSRVNDQNIKVAIALCIKCHRRFTEAAVV